MTDRIFTDSVDQKSRDYIESLKFDLEQKEANTEDQLLKIVEYYNAIGLAIHYMTKYENDALKYHYRH